MNNLDNKADTTHFDDVQETYDGKEAPRAVMKSSLDRLSVFQAMKVYKRAVAVAMLAAFSASLDGYRESCTISGLISEINLNGSIIANKGFIQTMASAANKKKKMDADRVSV